MRRLAVWLLLGLWSCCLQPGGSLGLAARLGKRQTRISVELKRRADADAKVEVQAQAQARAEVRASARAETGQASLGELRDACLQQDRWAYVVLVLAQASPLLAPHGRDAAQVFFLVLSVATIYLGVRQQPFCPRRFLDGVQARGAPLVASVGLLGAYFFIKYSAFNPTIAYVIAVAILGTLETGAALDLLFRAFAPAALRSQLVAVDGVAARVLRGPPRAEGAAADVEEEGGKEAEEDDGIALRATAVAGLATSATISLVYMLASQTTLIAVPDEIFALLNNIIGWGICLQTLGSLSFSSFGAACTLLVGLLLYDAWWTFYTPVMVTVATKIEAPIKFQFPILPDAATSLSNYPYSILGLGDVVVPGIFIGFLYSFERARLDQGWPTAPYSLTGLSAYGVGLLLTFTANRITAAGQPALFYIVPCLLLATLALAQRHGELARLIEFDAKPRSGSEAVGEEER